MPRRLFPSTCAAFHVLAALVAVMAGSGPQGWFTPVRAQTRADLPCNDLCRWWMNQSVPGSEPTPWPAAVEAAPAPPRPAMKRLLPSPPAIPTRAPLQALKARERPRFKTVHGSVAPLPPSEVAGGSAAISRLRPSPPTAPAPKDVVATTASPLPEAPSAPVSVRTPDQGTGDQAIPAWMVPVAPLDDPAPARPGMPAASSASVGPQAVEETAGLTGAAPQAALSKSIALPVRPEPAPDPLGGATTLVVRVAVGVSALDDLNGRKVAVGYPDGERQVAIAATFRSLSLTPELMPLPMKEAERQFQAGSVTGIATLTDDANAATAEGHVLKIRLEPYVVRQSRQPPS